MERHEDECSQGVLRKARSLRRLEPGASPSERSAAGTFALAERISELKANILSLHNLRHELNANEALAVRQLRAHVDREALVAGDQKRDIQQVLARYNASSDHFQNQAAMDGLRRALDQEATHALAVAARRGPQERVGRIQSHTQASVELGVLLDALSGFAHVWHACKDANLKCSALETALEETNRALAQTEEERDLYHDALASSSDADAVHRVRNLRAHMGKIRHLSSATKSARLADAYTQTQDRALRASLSSSRSVASTQTPHSQTKDEAADERARMAEDRLHASAARICELEKTVRSLKNALRALQKQTEQVCEPGFPIVGESSSKFAQTEDFLTTSNLSTTREVAMQHSALQPVMIEAGAQTSFMKRELRSCGAQTKSMNHCHQAVQAAWLRAEQGAQTMTWKEAVRESDEVGDLVANQVAELASFQDALDAKEKIEAGLRAELEQVADAKQASLARQDAQDAEALEGLRVEAKILHARIAAHGEEKELYEETIGSLRAQIRGLMSMHEKSHGLEAPTPSTSEARELRTLAREVSEALHNRLQLHLELLCTARTTTGGADGASGELRVPDAAWPALQAQLEAADKALQGLLERLKQVGLHYHC